MILVLRKAGNTFGQNVAVSLLAGCRENHPTPSVVRRTCGASSGRMCKAAFVCLGHYYLCLVSLKSFFCCITDFVIISCYYCLSLNIFSAFIQRRFLWFVYPMILSHPVIGYRDDWIFYLVCNIIFSGNILLVSLSHIFCTISCNYCYYECYYYVQVSLTQNKYYYNHKKYIYYTQSTLGKDKNYSSNMIIITYSNNITFYMAMMHVCRYSSNAE